MERWVHGEVDTIEIPVGYIPYYDDLKKLFNQYLDSDYSKEDYQERFTVSVDKFIAKFERMEKVYSQLTVPEEFMDELKNQQQRLKEARNQYQDTRNYPE